MFRPPVFPNHPVPSLRQKGTGNDHTHVPTPRDELSIPRPFSMPNIVGFDGLGLGSMKGGKTNGYFPPRKPKSSKGTPRVRPSTRAQKISPDNTLALETHLGVTSPRPLTGTSSSAGEIYKTRDKFRPRKSRETPRPGVKFSDRQTPDISSHIPDRLTFQEPKREDEVLTGDLSYLTKPKALEPGRCSPWVYRYKVKRSMNNLSRIMASQPSSTTIAYRVAR